MTAEIRWVVPTRAILPALLLCAACAGRAEPDLYLLQATDDTSTEEETAAVTVAESPPEPNGCECRDGDGLAVGYPIHVRALVLYTAAARDNAGFDAAMIEVDIDNAIEEVNLALDDSGIPVKLVLAHAVEVDFEGDSDPNPSDPFGLPYPASTNDLVCDLRDSDDDFLNEEAHSLRDAYFADVVVLWYHDHDESKYSPRGAATELAYVLFEPESQAFAVVDHAAVEPYFTFAHELGHIFGARHERGAISSQDGFPFGYNHGYVVEDPEWTVDEGILEPSETVDDMCAGGWYTLMGTEQSDWCDNCCRINIFSNPEISINGNAAGEESTASLTPPLTDPITGDQIRPCGGPADNRKTLHNTASTIARYRMTPAWFLSASGRAPWQELRIADDDLAALAFGDFNGDGEADVFRTVTENGQTDWEVSYSGVSTWQTLESDMGPYEVSDLVFGRFDDDKLTDVFRVDATNEIWYVWHNGGSAGWEEYGTDTGAHDLSELAFGDFNDDDLTDVFRVNDTEDGKEWSVSYGGASSLPVVWESLRTNPGDYQVSQLEFHDFNGDGITDVMAHGAGIEQFNFWVVSDGGTGTWRNVRMVPATYDQEAVIEGFSFADFDGDKAADAFTVLPCPDSWTVLFGKKPEGEPDPSIWSFGPGVTINGSCVVLDDLRFADFNGDGVTDVFRVGVRP